MKLTSFFALVSLGVLIGCSHIQDTKRILASVDQVGVIGPDGEVLPCGLKGSVDERIEDCSYQFTSENEGFVLVTRSEEFKEVYKDLSTGLLWSDDLPSYMPHYRAQRACSVANRKDLPDITGVHWTLPSIDQYKEAEKNGIKKVRPTMNRTFWSSSIPNFNNNWWSNPREAWAFDDRRGIHLNHDRNEEFWVRCVSYER